MDQALLFASVRYYTRDLLFDLNNSD